jgi:hypothetical protein
LGFEGNQGMNIYVWRGPLVLKNYGSGLVVVVAESHEDALERLRKQNFRAWAWLQTGSPWFDGEDYYYTEDDIEQECLEREWTVPKPEVFTVDTLPILIIEGGE